MLRTTLAALTAYGLMRRAPAHAAGPELRLAPNVPEEKFDFGATGIDGWTTITGQWAVETIAGAPTGRKVLVQRAVKNWFNAIIAPPGPYTDVEASVKFLTISGREDASCGIVFRYDDGKCYAVRANALEDSFSLYAFERGRRQLASATVSKPPLGQWHLLRVAALGDRIQAWLNGALLLDHRDSRFRSGRVGLWTRVDSVAAFDELTIRGVTGRG